VCKRSLTSVRKAGLPVGADEYQLEVVSFGPEFAVRLDQLRRESFAGWTL
jgi:hypothetical protein